MSIGFNYKGVVGDFYEGIRERMRSGYCGVG